MTAVTTVTILPPRGRRTGTSVTIVTDRKCTGLFGLLSGKLVSQHLLIYIEPDPSDLIGPSGLLEPDALGAEDLIVWS